MYIMVRAWPLTVPSLDMCQNMLVFTSVPLTS